MHSNFIRLNLNCSHFVSFFIDYIRYLRYSFFHFLKKHKTTILEVFYYALCLNPNGYDIIIEIINVIVGLASLRHDHIYTTLYSTLCSTIHVQITKENILSIKPFAGTFENTQICVSCKLCIHSLHYMYFLYSLLPYLGASLAHFYL